MRDVSVNPIENYTIPIALVSAVTMIVGAVVTTNGCTNQSAALTTPTATQSSSLNEINIGKVLIYAGSVAGSTALWGKMTGSHLGAAIGALLGIVPAWIVVNSVTSKCTS